MLSQRGQGIGVENIKAQYSAFGAVNMLSHLLHLNFIVPQIILQVLSVVKNVH